MKITSKLSILIVVLLFIAATAIYPVMPARMATHWNTVGEVNGYMPKVAALYLLPVISLILLLIFFALPLIDPFKNNYKDFSKSYHGFILVLTLYLAYIYALSLMANLSEFNSFNFMQLLAPAFFVLFFYLGILVENAKRNWFVGIRTPWTLSSEKIWEKTHHIGGKLYKISSFLALLGIIWPSYLIYFILIPILASSVFVVVYSYFLFKKR